LLSTTKRPDRRPSERGQVLILFAGGLVTLLIIAALAFDVGMVLLERRDEQNAADAAALAGARYVLTSSADAETAARRIAAMNGFNDADPNQVVHVYIPPIHGNPAYRQAGFIEVQIEATRPSIFGGIIGRAVWPVGAYAIATNRQDLHFTFSMLALDPTACKAIQVSGTGSIDAAGSIQSNSTGVDCTSAAVSFSRTGGSTITVGADVYCRGVGPIQDQGSGSMGACIKAPNSFALPDPLRNLPAPTMPGVPTLLGKVGHSLNAPPGCPTSSAPASATSPALCDLGGNGSRYNGKAWVLYPGLYPGGISVTNDAIVYMMPGIYWIGGGGLNLQRGTIISVATAPATVASATFGGGVMVYNSSLPSSPGGPISQNATYANMQLKPLQATSPDPNAIYNNIVIFQDRTLDISGDDVTLNGSSSGTRVEGMVYLPIGDVKLNGNGRDDTLTIGQIIANTYLIDGNGGSITVTDDDLYEAIIIAAGLVE
jgi:Putative Flp pilus-assembly TadE/G-like